MFKEIENAWTNDSGGYDELIQKQLENRRDVEHWTNELKAVLGDKPLRVLEVGCGPGFFSVLLCRLGHHVKAIDGAEGMVRCARKNLRADGWDEAVVEEQDAVRLPNEAAGSYDAIVSRDVVWTLYDPERAFARWKEVLKPGGRIIYYDGNYRRDRHDIKTKLWEWFSQVFLTVVVDHKKPENKEHHDPNSAFGRLPLVTRERPEADGALLRAAGYADVEIIPDKYRNSPGRSEFWRYGYQGRKFRVIAAKQE